MTRFSLSGKARISLSRFSQGPAPNAWCKIESGKERWAQVLREADKIKAKHLLTLEPGISESQTAEMQRSQLQLVLPRSLHATYSLAERNWLMDVSGFIADVKSI